MEATDTIGQPSQDRFDYDSDPHYKSLIEAMQAELDHPKAATALIYQVISSSHFGITLLNHIEQTYTPQKGRPTMIDTIFPMTQAKTLRLCVDNLMHSDGITEAEALGKLDPTGEIRSFYPELFDASAPQPADNCSPAAT